METDTEKKTVFVIRVGESTPDAYIYNWTEEGQFDTCYTLEGAQKFDSYEAANSVRNNLNFKEFLKVEEREV